MYTIRIYTIRIALRDHPFLAMLKAKEKPGSLFNKLQRQQAWQLLAFAVFNGASVAGN